MGLDLPFVHLRVGFRTYLLLDNVHRLHQKVRRRQRRGQPHWELKVACWDLVAPEAAKLI